MDLGKPVVVYQELDLTLALLDDDAVVMMVTAIMINNELNDA